jgi:glyoxylase-like metal-dependent hydrolase (beta-lactamase superfamily II)
MTLGHESVTVTGTRQQQAWRDRLLPPVEQVRRDMWSIPTVFPNNPLRYVVSYAIQHGSGIALIDTGWPCAEAWDGLVAGLHTAGWDVTDVRAVLVTHGHADHYGLARRVRERSGAWIGLHEADARIQRDFADQDAYHRAEDRWLARRGGQANGQLTMHTAQGEMPDEFHLIPDRFLPDRGSPLGAAAGLTTVWTPGHTPGHVCFIDSQRDAVLTGDHVLPRITPNISPMPTDDSDTLGAYLGSLTLLAELATGEVLPAHEYRFVGLQQRVHDIRAHHQERLAEVLTCLRADPGASTVEVAEALHWSRPWNQMQGMPRRFAIGEAYAHLIHLKQTGFIAHTGTKTDTWYAVSDTDPKLT